MAPEDLKQSLRQITAEAAELKDASGAALTDVVADWLVPQYVVAGREQLAAHPTGEEHWKVLRMMAGDLSALRRGDHCAERLRLERERLNLLREQLQKTKEAEFEEWLKRPEVRERVNPRHRRERVMKGSLQIAEHRRVGTPLPEF